MAETQPDEPKVELNNSRFVGVMLTSAAVLLSLVVIAWAVARFWVQTHAPIAPPLSDYLFTLLTLIGGCSAGLLLWGLAELVRRLDTLNEAVTGMRTAPAAAVIGAPAASGGDSAAIAELVSVLREVRDVALLNDQQRAMRLELLGREELSSLEQQVPALIREHNWVEAERRIRAARQRFPSISGWDALQQQVDRMRASVEAHDIETASRQVHDLVALGAWDRATEVVQELLQRHPTAAKAQEIARRLSNERDKAETDTRARLLAQAQEATNARDWHAALSTAQTLIQRYPRSPEAEALRQQLPVLRENAEIQTRQRMESDIVELVKQQRFNAAIRVARDVLSRFPSSPQAAALRQQLPRLEQKAIEHGQTV